MKAPSLHECDHHSSWEVKDPAVVVVIVVSATIDGFVSLWGDITGDENHHGVVFFTMKMKGDYVEWRANQPSNNQSRVLYTGKGWMEDWERGMVDNIPNHLRCHRSTNMQARKCYWLRVVKGEWKTTPSLISASAGIPTCRLKGTIDWTFNAPQSEYQDH